MAAPTTVDFDTDHLDQGSDDPSQAREDLYQIAVALAAIINSFGGASGVCLLDAQGLVPLANLPVVTVNQGVNAVPITKGGTGATNAADARTNLGIANSGGDITMLSEGDKIYWGAPANGNFIRFNNGGFEFYIGGVQKQRIS